MDHSGKLLQMGTQIMAGISLQRIMRTNEPNRTTI
jgi:hypothetical protein